MSEPLREDEETSWLEFFNRFEEHIWPMFSERGFTRDAALIAWQVNSTRNTLDDLLTKLLERDE